MIMIMFLIISQIKVILYLYIKSMSIFFDCPTKVSQDTPSLYQKKNSRKRNKFTNSLVTCSERRKDNLNNLSLRSKKNIIGFSEDLQGCLVNSSFQRLKVKHTNIEIKSGCHHDLDLMTNYFTRTQRVKKQLKTSTRDDNYDHRYKNTKMHSSVNNGAPHSFSALYRKASNKVKILTPAYFLKIEGIVLKNKKQNQFISKILTEAQKQTSAKEFNDKSPLKNKLLSKQTEAEEEEWSKGIYFEKNNRKKLYNMKKKKSAQSSIRKNSMHIEREYSYPFQEIIRRNPNRGQMTENEEEQFQFLKRVNTIN